MINLTKKRLYWIAQLTGWFIFSFLLGVIAFFTNKTIDVDFVLNLLTIYVLGIILSHLLRLVIVHWDWFNRPLLGIIPRVLIATIVFAALYCLLQTLISQWLIAGTQVNILPIDFLLKTINYTLLLILWTTLYFLFHFIQNYKREEIKNLQWQAKKNEMELNRLKSQLNPHFIFNSMNSIRALIDENPKEAKNAITRLSNILRNSLQMDSKKFIPLKEELELVEDYLSIEKTRFEERLNVNKQIEHSALNVPVPPMMLQTLIENAIKHGISKLQEGGTVNLSVKDLNDRIVVKITNPGRYVEENNKGYGIINTKQRLSILYKNKAKFKIQNTQNNKVETTIEIPKYECNNS